MVEYRFGYWTQSTEYAGKHVAIRPANSGSAESTDQWAQRGKTYFMPHILAQDGGGFAPAGRFELPVTHVLSMPGCVQDAELGEFMVLVLGFLHGLRFTIEGTGHLFPTPHLEGTLVDFRPKNREVIPCMETALKTWKELEAEKRKLLFGAIHWYLVSQSYPNQFERFNWQYSVLDNLYKLKFGKGGAHGERPVKLAETYEVNLPTIFRDNFTKKRNAKCLVVLRNELVHEARWLERPLGYAVAQDGHDIIQALTYFNSQIILGALGIECGFRALKWGSQQIHLLGVVSRDV